MEDKSKMIEFISPIPPSVNDYLGHRVVFKLGKHYPQPYKKPKAVAYINHVIKTINRVIEEQNWLEPTEETYILCEVVVYKEKKNQDADNMFKCLLDAIKETNVVYDDCMIIPQVVDIFIDSINPRLEVRLTHSCKNGVFQSDAHMQVFIQNNCDLCKKYYQKTNCSYLRKSLENRLIPEVDYKNLKCEKVIPCE